jgi:competence protein ComEC
VETQNHLLIYDTGAQFSSTFDMGRTVVAPYLQSRHYEHIDTLIISHADNDHRGGMDSIQEIMQVAQTLSSDPGKILSSTSCQAGQSWEWDKVRFEILWPNPDTPGSRNNRSCVLKVTADNVSVLLPGDIEKESEHALVERYGHRLKADVLIAPHHGSRTSSTHAFIEAVSPHDVLFPVGRLNRYGFPKQDVIQRYQDRDIVIHRTDQHGAVLMQAPMRFIHWREKAQKMWTAPPTE